MTIQERRENYLQGFEALRAWQQFIRIAEEIAELASSVEHSVPCKLVDHRIACVTCGYPMCDARYTSIARYYQSRDC